MGFQWAANWRKVSMSEGTGGGILGLRVRKQWSSRRIQSGRRQQSIVCSRNSLVFRAWLEQWKLQRTWKWVVREAAGLGFPWWLKPLGGLWLFFWAKWGVTVRESTTGYRQKDPHSSLFWDSVLDTHWVTQRPLQPSRQVGGYGPFPPHQFYCDAMVWKHRM